MRKGPGELPLGFRRLRRMGAGMMGRSRRGGDNEMGLDKVRRFSWAWWGFARLLEQ